LLRKRVHHCNHAGLKASLAEEEQTAATAAALGGINAWVQAIKPASVTSLQASCWG
jgi:hypothetical protein